MKRTSRVASAGWAVSASTDSPVTTSQSCQRTATRVTAATVPWTTRREVVLTPITVSATPDACSSLAEDALLDELFLDEAPLGLEPALLEALAELQRDLVDAAAVLLDGHDHPLAEALGVLQVVDEVVLGHDVVLVVEDENDVGLVGEGGGAAQVVDAHPLAGHQAALLGRDDGEHRHLELQGEVLEPLHDHGHPLRRGAGEAGHGHLLEVVDEDERRLGLARHDRLDGRPDLVERRVQAAGGVDVEVVAVPLQRGHRLDTTGGGLEALTHGVGVAVAGLEALPDLGEADAVGAGDGTGLDGDQALEDAVGVVLVGEEDRRPAGGQGVARPPLGRGWSWHRLNRDRPPDGGRSPTFSPGISRRGPRRRRSGQGAMPTYVVSRYS